MLIYLCSATFSHAVPTAQAATLADKRLVVAVDCWEADSLYPSGHYVRTLGAIGDKETETEVGGWVGGWGPYVSGGAHVLLRCSWPVKKRLTEC